MFTFIDIVKFYAQKRKFMESHARIVHVAVTLPPEISVCKFLRSVPKGDKEPRCVFCLLIEETLLLDRPDTIRVTTQISCNV